jgi:type I restriction enzyme S subunit
VLELLDDKVEVNRRMIRKSLELTRVLLSRGKSTVRVGDVAQIVKGLTYKGGGLAPAGPDTIPMVNLANFTQDGWLSRAGFKYYRGPFQDRHKVVGGDLMIANTDLTQRRVILGRAALLPEDIPTALFTHHVYAVRFNPLTDVVRLGLWGALQGRPFRERAEGFATGTTVAMLPADAVLNLVFPTPTAVDATRARRLLERAWAAERETGSLAALRALLLPRLVGGELRVGLRLDRQRRAPHLP